MEPQADEVKGDATEVAAEPHLTFRTRLVGTCGHDINVLIRDQGEDLRVISEAMRRNESAALLVRFCPYCGDNREFVFNFGNSVFHISELPSELCQIDFPYWMPSVSLPPVERAFRLLENGQKHLASDDVQERKLAEAELKLAADLFERQRMTMQYEVALEDLIDIYESQERVTKAEAIREKLQQIPFYKGRRPTRKTPAVSLGRLE